MLFTNKTYIILGLFVLSLFTDEAGAQINFTANVDKTYLSGNDHLRLEIEVSGPIGSLPSPELPDLNKDFYVLTGPNESTSYQIVNSSMSASRTLTYILQPRSEGAITIPSMTLEYKRKQYKTEPIQITVSNKGVSGSTKKQSESDKGQTSGKSDLPEVFLKAEPDKTTLVQNDAVIINYKLYFTVNISSYEITKSPNTMGFWTENFDLPRQPIIETETVDGKRYQTAVIYKSALFPTKPGKLTIDPLEIQCQVQEQKRRRGRDIFDSIFDDPFFSSAMTVPKYFQSQPITLNVLSFPEANKPANFSGAVGDFNLNVDIDKDSVQVNDPITLTVTIAGKGNVRFIPAPNLKLSADFETYEPEVNSNTGKSGGVIRGSKTFKYLLVPRFPGVQKIDPIEFSYYDPMRKQYVTKHSGGYQIKAARGNEVLLPGGVSVSPEAIKLYGQDIHFIKTAGHLQTAGNFYYLKTWYYLAYIIPLLIFTGSSLGRYLYINRNPQLIRRKNAFRRANSIITNAEKKLAATGSEEFYKLVSDGLKGYIADKLSVPPAGIVLEDIQEKVLRCGVSVENISELTQIMNDCEMGRFVPSSGEANSKVDMVRRSKKALEKLEGEWK